MSVATTYRWQGGALVARDDCDVAPATILAADSWLVAEGTVLAIGLHRARFFDAVFELAERRGRTGEVEQLDLDSFWDVAIARIPRAGDWFPRVELRVQHDAAELLLRVRPAPARHRALKLVTFRGRDPRTEPWIKGPDLEAMTRLRTQAQQHGADEAVLLDTGGLPDAETDAGNQLRPGAVAEGSTTALAWWAGDALCVPSIELPRVDSVTLRSVLALATATGVDVLHERIAPEALEGYEVWALNALHGIRIVTGWVDGPATAELPGRLDSWRARLDALRRPLPAASPSPASEPA